MRAQRPASREIAGIIVTVAAVLGVTGGLLRAADSLPALLRGREGVAYLPSIEAAERTLGERLWLPAYFPDTFAWPPTVVAVHRGPPPFVTLTFADRAGEPVLVVSQSLGSGAPALPGPLPSARVLHRVTVRLHGDEAMLARVVGRDGRTWHDLAWEMHGRRLSLLARASADEVLRMASSVRGRP